MAKNADAAGAVKVISRKGVGNGQCVAFARQASGIKIYGNAITWKRHINSKVPKVGSVVVLNYGKYGHVAVVKAVHGNTITIHEQNSVGKNIINSRVISKFNKSILGYIVKTPRLA